MRASLRFRPLTAAAVFALAALATDGLSAQDVEVTTECAPARFRAQLMTPMTGTAPRGASLVAGLFAGGELRELPTVELARGRRRTTALVRTEIAPGLYRLTPDARRIYGRWNVSGLPGDPQIVFGRPALPPAPTRPVLTRLERYAVISGTQQRREVRAHFSFPIPSGVVALVLYFGDDDTPDLFARATPTRDDAVIWSATGSCSDLPPGASPPPDEGTVRVAFVDQHGQISQPSAPQPLSP